MSKLELLKEVQDEVKACASCPLHCSRTNTVFGSGSSDSPVVFVGEAPGQSEDEQGIPFCGRSGKLLTNMIKSIGLERDQVYIVNICKCRPPNNRKPLPNEMSACLPFLHRQLEIIKPKVIVALGSTSVEGLLGSGLGITKRRGNWESYKGIDVMPSLHPAYLLRNPPAKTDAWKDFQEVAKRLQK